MNSIECRDAINLFMATNGVYVNQLYREFNISGMGVSPDSKIDSIIIYFVTNNKSIDINKFPKKVGDTIVTLEYRPIAKAY